MAKQIFFIFILTFCVDSIRSADNDTSIDSDQLVFAHIIYRHADRSPLFPYPLDPYNNVLHWPEGTGGHLTKAGKLRHYQLGKYLRKRYFKLLVDGRYSADKVYVQSSNKDRTLMSAAANLAGFFPAESDQIWNDEIPNWLPIPIHTLPEELDHLLATDRPCPRYKKAYGEQISSPEFKALVDTIKKYFKLLEDKAGFKDANFWSLFGTWDTLNSEKFANLKLPEWSNEIMAPNSSAIHFVNQSFTFMAKTKEMQRLKGGFLIREMLERFKNKSESKLKPDRSLIVYSAHDMNIIYLLSCLGLFEPHVPPYASCLFFELYKTKANSFYIQLFYKNTSSEEPILPMNLPGCGIKCSLSQFYEIFKDIIPTGDFETECKLPESLDLVEDASFLSLNNDLIFPICCTIVIIISTI